MRRSTASLLAVALVGCWGSAPPAPTAPAYGEFRNPFPAAAPAEAPPTSPPEAPAASPPPPAPSPASRKARQCGSICGECSRASEACDEEVRRTNARGPQCAIQTAKCNALVALKRATSCKCPDDEDD